jgi:hypothetical protein
MTAVEWLLQQMDLETISKYDKQLVKAKEMEKQQIIKAKDCWFEDERDGEQYYSETYKK